MKVWFGVTLPLALGALAVCIVVTTVLWPSLGLWALAAGFVAALAFEFAVAIVGIVLIDRGVFDR